MILRTICTLTFVALCSAVYSQPGIVLEPYRIDNMPAVHSGVFLSYKGKWLMIGGRTNGLHAFQGAQLFSQFTQNRSVIVVDPLSRRVLTAPTQTLSASIREHICSSNMQWILRGSELCIVGGYGYSAAVDDWLTFPCLTVVNVDSLIYSVEHSLPLTALFRQVRDDRFAVCGGHIDESSSEGEITLVFGHRFDGMYNKDTIGNFVQRYVYGLRRIEVDVTSLKVGASQEITDTAQFRRRDYNLVPHYDGTSEFSVAYSGVFKKRINRPYTSAVEIHDAQPSIVPDFNQKFAHYHCAVVPVWDERLWAQHTYFIGGMAEWSVKNGVPVLDTAVPFVKTISCVTRDKNGHYQEQVIDTLNAFLGTNAYFFENPEATRGAHSRVVKLIPEKQNVVGYFYGGIVSPLAHISNVDPQMSNASSAVYRVLIDTRTTAVTRDESYELSISAFQSTKLGDLTLHIHSPLSSIATIDVTSLTGYSIVHRDGVSLHPGFNEIVLPANVSATGFYTVSVHTISGTTSAMVIVVK